MPDPYFFFRPILAPDHSWAALDWQAQSLQETAPSAFIRCFSDSAASPLAGMLPLVTPIQSDFMLQDDFLKAFEADPVVFVMPCGCLQDEQIIARCIV